MTHPPRTVFWIDDDRLLLGVCSPALQKRGYRVLTATEGRVGIAIAHRERPDVILVDVIMASMHGLEVCKALREDSTLHETPIILLTALVDPGLRVMAQKVQATRTMEKPVDPEELVRAIEEVMNRTPRSATPPRG